MNFLVKYSSDGRITIPREVRLQLELNEAQDLELHVDENNQIVVTKKLRRCNICGSEEVFECKVNNRIVHLCDKCLDELKEGRGVKLLDE